MIDTWTCHICKKERQDSRISVYSSTIVTPGGLEMKQNVRYCNDNPDCIEKAKTHSFIGVK